MREQEHNFTEAGEGKDLVDERFSSLSIHARKYLNSDEHASMQTAEEIAAAFESNGGIVGHHTFVLQLDRKQQHKSPKTFAGISNVSQVRNKIHSSQHLI